MKKPVLSLFLIAISMQLFAQSGVIKVSDGKVTEGDLYLKNQYVLHDFLDAIITLKDGTTYDGKININTVTQTLRMIDVNGDTLGVNIEKSIKAVSAGAELFYKINGMYVRIIDTDGEIFLGQIKALKIGEESKKGPYGGSGEVASITTVGVLDSDNMIEHIPGDATLKVDLRRDLFFIKNDKLYPVTKKNLARLFPKQSGMIESYMKTNGTNLNRDQDVKRLFDFILNNRQL
ncbi:MAG: hypothetical protein A2X18_04495 [Bacteroidetes bacterium GWF2_40_14]|jgi:hypothetical protein|nr:MAG: hypothetical protein A2X18_04495 [Bacteroidetes bacterium GWF2_40_14]